MNIFGVFDLCNGDCSIQSVGVKQKRIGDLEVWVLNATSNDLTDIIAQKSAEGNTLNIDEMYLAFVYNHVKQSLCIFSDITTSPLNLYYTQNNQKFYFSTSLKRLLHESSINRHWNKAAAKAFLANGYIVGNETLVEGVYKLDFGCELLIENGKVSHICVVPSVLDSLRPKEAKKQLLPTIRESILKNFETEEQVYMPLSNGYDSNLILDTVLKNTSVRIHAFTVGGKNGVNEIEAVKRNVCEVQQVELHTALIDESYFGCLSDIVWRLEGCVYESGVFLQYALARKASELGATYLLCGEGSDEVQNKYYSKSMARVFAGDVSRDKKYFTYSDPFIGTHMMILKKSGVMLNSFGITGRYPFKSAHVADVAKACARYNGTGKTFYKKQCKKEFLLEVSKSIKTRGGTTGVRSTISLEELERLKALLKDHDLIAKIRNTDTTIVTDSWTERRRKEQGLHRLLSEIRDEGLLSGLKRIKTNRRNKWLTTVFKEAYLLIFNELFISGRFDDYFEDESVPLTTGELLFGEVKQ